MLIDRMAPSNLAQKPLPTSRPDTPSTPQDRVSLSASSPVLWSEAAALGLLAAGAASPGPLSAVLSTAAMDELNTLMANLKSRGITLSGSELRWTVSGAGIEDVEARSLKDLQVLDALYVRQEPHMLSNPPLAQALMQLDGAGQVFFHVSESEEDPIEFQTVGVYGAYREVEYAPQRQNVRVGGPDALKASYEAEANRRSKPLKAAWSAIAAATFHPTAPPLQGEALKRLETLRSMAREGFTFHDPASQWTLLTPEEAYAYLQTSDRIDLGVGGVKQISIQLDTPIPPDVRELQQLYHASLQPLLEKGEVTSHDVTRFIQKAQTPYADFSLRERWQMLDGLRELHTRWFTPGQEEFRASPCSAAADDAQWLLTHRAEDEALRPAHRAYQTLLRHMDHPHARKVFTHVREHLAPEDASEFVRLAIATSHADIAKAGWEMASFKINGLPRADRLQTLHDLIGLEQRIGEGRWRTGDGLPAERRLPSWRAVEDYKLLMKYRLDRESLAQAATTWGELHRALAPREGWKAATEVFTFIQEGVERNRFPDIDTPQKAAERFLEYYLVSNRVDLAQARLVHPPANREQSGVEAEEQGVVIDGVYIPRRG